MAKNYRKKQPKTLEKKVDKLARDVRSIAEVPKYFDQLLSQSISWTGTVSSILYPAQGSAESQRNGDAVRSKSISIHGMLYAGDAYNFVRIIVFVDKATDGSTPLSSELLQYTGSTSTPFSPYNWSFRDRFRILKDKTIKVIDNMDNELQMFKFNTKVNYVNKFNTGVVTPITNGLYVMAISDSSAVTHPAILMYCRVMYTE